ncbi:MAG: hypothetical protein ACYC35_11390 [Pirellulales bacterium]
MLSPLAFLNSTFRRRSAGRRRGHHGAPAVGRGGDRGCRLRGELLEPRTMLSLVPFGSNYTSPSEFMLGDVYVTVVLLESNGTIDPSTEDWTPSEIQQVEAEIQEGAKWWQDTLTTYSSVQSLQFVLDFTHADSPVATGYEPINRAAMANQGLWIDEFLNSVGKNTPASYSDDLDHFNDDQRVAHGTNWAMTVFVVNSVNDADGKFPDDRYAYSYVGGPFLVMTYDNERWGISRMSQVFAHETTHIFYALDEYPGSRTYDSRSGYYNTQNLNAYDGNPDPSSRVASLNAEAALLNTAWADHVTSPSSRAMMGWQDSDGDGIFDLLDVPLSLTGSGTFNATTGQYQFSGNSSVQTLPNQNPSGPRQNITINTVDRAQYRIDGGAWTSFATYGTYTATVAGNLGPFTDGFHQIQIRTIDDDLGVASNTFSDTLIVDAAPRVVETSVNHGAAQRSTIGALSIRFDQDVEASLDYNDLKLYNESTKKNVNIAGIIPTYDPATNTATWDFPWATIGDGYYTATLSAAGVTDPTGHPLAGGDYVFQFFRLMCDTDGNGHVDIFDVAAVQVNYGQTAGMTPAEGDFDGDGDVDIFDITVLQRAFGYSVGPAPPAGMAGAPDALAVAASAPAASASSMGFAPPTAASAQEPVRPRRVEPASDDAIFVSTASAFQTSVSAVRDPVARRLAVDALPASDSAKPNRPVLAGRARLQSDALGVARAHRASDRAAWESAVDRCLESGSFDLLATDGLEIGARSSRRRQ